jgi:hypothetical protein
MFVSFDTPVSGTIEVNAVVTTIVRFLKRPHQRLNLLKGRLKMEKQDRHVAG